MARRVALLVALVAVALRAPRLTFGAPVETPQTGATAPRAPAQTIGALAAASTAPPTAQPHQQQQQLQAQQLQVPQMQAFAHDQLNGFALAANQNSSSVGSKYATNVLDALSSMGKVIQQQISAAQSHVHIVTSPANGLSVAGQPQESANSKATEYESIAMAAAEPVTGANGSLVSPAPPINSAPLNSLQANAYREQGEQLRHEIVRRAGQLQQVVTNSMDLLKNNGDLIMRRLLEQMNVRLDQAKAKADKIVNEPATNELAVRALATINSGLNNLNTIITNIVARLDLVARDQQRSPATSGAAAAAAAATNSAPSIMASSAFAQHMRRASSMLAAGGANVAPNSITIDPSRIRVNLQQLGQQVHAALNGTQLHQQIVARRQQILALAAQPQPQQFTLQQQQLKQHALAGAPTSGDTPSATNKVNTDFVNH